MWVVWDIEQEGWISWNLFCYFLGCLVVGIGIVKK